MLHQILISNHRLAIPVFEEAAARAESEALGTVLSNLAAYGYAPSLTALESLRSYSSIQLASFWSSVRPALDELTGANRNMGQFVVYKNFPAECLNKTQAEYWVAQIFMYLGAPNEWFTELESERSVLNEKLELKVLDVARDDEISHIVISLVNAKARWSDRQVEHAIFLANLNLHTVSYELSAFGFKENGINLIKATLQNPLVKWRIVDATDVLRLAAAMSDGDVSLREQVTLRKFNRAERRALLSLLDCTKNLAGDFAMRPEQWKLLLAKLHPGDYSYHNVITAYHGLYRGEVKSFNSRVETLLAASDPAVLELLETRPGEFYRRYYKLCSVFGLDALASLVRVAPKLTNHQLVKLELYLNKLVTRQTFIYPPKGSWRKAQIVPNTHSLDERVRQSSISVLQQALTLKLSCALPEGVALSLETHDVKLQTSDSKLASYGRGTVFRLPPEATFIRTASYWACVTQGLSNVWFDNGWNFFDESWKVAGTCCWNATRFLDGAIFSGDPTNSKDLKGRACQMIDLYPEKLLKLGVRYAVWNVLAYSDIPFSDAEDVLATLQWGENAETGKLYEPARAQLVFPLKSKAKTSYVAYVDLKSRELVYMDVDFGGAVNSAVTNGSTLQTKMPAYVDYLSSLPSVADVFVHAPEGKTPILYTDEGVDLPKGEPAYVFKPVNPNNSFVPLKLESLL